MSQTALIDLPDNESDEIDALFNKSNSIMTPDQIKTFIDSIQEIIHENEVLKHQVEKLTSINESLQDKLSTSNTNYINQSKEMKTIRLENQQLTIDMQDLEHKYDNLNDKYTNKCEYVSTLENKNKELKLSLSDATERIDTLVEQNKVITAQNTELKSKVEHVDLAFSAFKSIFS